MGEAAIFRQAFFAVAEMRLGQKRENQRGQDGVAAFGMKFAVGEADEDALVAGAGQGHDGVCISGHSPGDAAGDLFLEGVALFGGNLAGDEIERDGFEPLMAGPGQIKNFSEGGGWRRWPDCRRLVFAEDNELADLVVAAIEDNGSAEPDELGMDEQRAAANGDDFHAVHAAEKRPRAGEIEIGEDVEIVGAGSEAGGDGRMDAGPVQAGNHGG